MGLRQAIANWLFKGQSIVAEGAISPFQANQPYQRFGKLSNQQLIERNISWAYACSNRNATTCAQTQLRLYAVKPDKSARSRFISRKADENEVKALCERNSFRRKIVAGYEVEEILQHPLLDLLQNVNERDNEFDLKYLTISSLEVTGNAYILKERDNMGVPIRLWLLLPQLVKPILDRKKFIAYWEYGRQLNKIKIPVSEIIHAKFPDLSDPILGVSTLQKAMRAVDLSINMNIYDTAMFANGGRPDVIMTAPKETKIDKNTQKRIRKEYFQTYGKPQNAGKLLVLSGGMDLKELSFSPKDMQYLKGRQWTLQEIAAIFGVPQTKFMIQDVSRANAEAADVEYKRETIKPRLKMLEEKLNEQLVPDFDDSLMLAFDNPVPKDVELRLKVIENHLRNKYSSVNEERAIDGLPPVAWGDEPIQNVSPIVAQSEPKVSSGAKKSFAPLEPDESDYNDWLEAIKSFFAKQGKVILSKADDEAFKYANIKTKSLAVKAIPDDLISAWFDKEFWEQELFKTFEPLILTGVRKGAAESLTQVMPEQTISSNTPAILNAAEKRKGVIVQINAHTRKLVRQAISQGIEEGFHANEIRTEIRRIFAVAVKEDIGYYRANRIARTEAIWAFNEGTVEGWRQSNVVTAKRWWTAQDERTCPYCSPMHDKVISLGDNFFNKGDEFQGITFSYEDINHPPLHPHCRCSLLPILEGE